MLVFGKYWFKKYQRILLFLLNAPVIKFWFRWIMRIRRHDLPLSVKIFRIEPNAFTWETGEPNEYSTDFRTHDKFAKRLYYAFKYVWYALHFIDWLFQPFPKLKLNFGFDTLTAYPDANPETDTVDGYAMRNSANSTWSSLHDGAGTSSNDMTTNNVITGLYAGTTIGLWSRIIRFFTLFNTSSLTSTATISGAVLSIYGNGVNNQLSQSINIVSSNPASNTALAATDYSNLGTTNYSSDLPLSSWSTSGYNTFTLNSNGIGNISKTSISKFGARQNSDISNTAPTWGNSYIGRTMGYLADQSGTTNDPKLVVTYTVPASSLIKKACGLTFASLKKENGLAEASIKKADGLNNV